MNPYEILGVDQNADDEQVKEAYREKAKEHHPDRGGDEEKFKEIQQAYETLTAEEESGFDESGPFQGSAPNFEGRYQNKTVEDFIRDFEQFASRGGFSGAGFQGDPFSGSGPFAGGEQTVVYRLQIDFEIAVLGGKVKVRMDNQTQEIEVPAGIKNGAKVNYGRNKMIRFDVENNTRYWRENQNDIYLEKNVSVWDAMTGADIEVETLQGETIKMTIDPGTSDGEIFRIPGRGGPQTYDGKPQGDMYVKTLIDIPAITNEKKVEVINDIR